MELRKYQERMIEGARSAIRNGKTKIIIHAATGSGKTIIAAAIVKGALEKGKRVLFLVHYRELAYQALNRFCDFGIGNDVGIIMAGEDSILGRPVQIASVQTYSRRLSLDDTDCNSWFHSADLVIYDECHASIAKTRKAILDLYKEDTIILGLTATPCRADGRGLGEVYEEIVSCVGIDELTEQGYLVPVIYYGCKEMPDLKNIPMVAGDYNKKVLGERVDLPKLVGDIYDNWARIAIDRQTVIFATNVKHSKHIKELFEQRGVKIEHIDAHTPEDERRDVLNRFESGAVHVVTNVGVYSEGADFPWASCIVLARPSKSYGRFVQMAGRGLRPFKDKTDCIARDTEILTDKGNVKIQNITLDHRIWNGVSFVYHQGAVCKGIKKTITYNGLTATPNHEVMTNEGWKTFQEAANRRLGIIKTGNGGEPLWFFGNNFKNNEREMGQIKSSGKMWKLWKRFYELLPQHEKKAEYESMSKLQPAYVDGRPEMALRESAGTEKQVPKQKRTPLSGLWRAWNKIQVQNGTRSNGMDKEQFRDTEIKEIAIRSNKQRWSLRTWKFKMDLFCAKYEQLSENKRGKKAEIYKFQETISICKICRSYVTRIYISWINRRRNNKKMEYPIKQTEREVWDILNAGALQRFTANGLLVHNCIIIDHAGLVHSHGFLEDDVYWTLAGKEKAWKKKKVVTKEKKIFECEMCRNMFTGNTCPQCGFKIKDWGKKILTTDDELVEIGKNKKPKATMAEKEQFYGMLEYERRQRGYSPGWSSHKFKEKFGVWPNSFKMVGPIVPDVKFLSYLKYLRIKWAKSKENPRNREAVA